MAEIQFVHLTTSEHGVKRMEFTIGYTYVPDITARVGKRIPQNINMFDRLFCQSQLYWARRPTRIRDRSRLTLLG